MRTISWNTVWRAVCRRRGLDPDETIGAVLAENIAESVNQHLKTAWEWCMWPSLLTCEQRTVATADSVDYVPLTATGKTDIGHVNTVSERNPRASTYPGYLEHSVRDIGIVLGDISGASVYVEFRGECPQFTRTAWSAETTYAADDVVYVAATGECYKALQASTNKAPATETDYWVQLEFPWMFFAYVRAAAYADYLEEHEDAELAVRARATADDVLSDLEDVQTAQQGQGVTANVTVG